MDAPGVPTLLSVRAMRALGAVLDVQSATLECKALGRTFGLKRAPGGHLLLCLADLVEASPSTAGENQAGAGAGAPLRRAVAPAQHTDAPSQ